MAAPFETAANEAMKDGDAGTSTDGTEKGAQLQLESTTSPRRTATKMNTRHKPSLLGLPAEIRLMIYDFLTTGDRNTDLHVFPLDCFTISTQPESPDYLMIPQNVHRTQQIIKSWSWIHTCRTMFDEGKWNVLKTHIVSFRSEAQFDFTNTDVLKNIRAFCFSGFHENCLACHVGDRIEKNVSLEVIRNFDRRDRMRRLALPERSVLLEVYP